MKFWRSKPTATFWLVLLLPVLLGVLATLQYRWLGEISAAERERLAARLEADVGRFARDFNNEITKVYFSFQIEEVNFKNPAALAERLRLWREQTDFPNLVGDLYVVERNSANDFSDDFALERFDAQQNDLKAADWTPELIVLREKLNNERKPKTSPSLNFSNEAIAANVPAVIIPVLETLERTTTDGDRFAFKTPASNNRFIIVKLNEEAIKNEIFPILAKRNFSGADFNFTVFDKTGDGGEQRAVYQSNANFKTAENADAVAGLFKISPAGAANILILNAGIPRVRTPREGSMVFQTRSIAREAKPKISIESENLQSAENGNLRQKIELRSNKTEVREETIVSNFNDTNGQWLLAVQHADGSLENFVGKTRWRNLGLSFGVLALLGASVVLLVVSSHRATRAAQRQIDFVSSVSHEFRTPVAVICSAGDNLADGIVSDREKIEKYGKLIRREGARLSEMVEQILEFAGAQSKKNYQFQPVEIAPLVRSVLSDCQPLLDEKNFAVETAISENLPPVAGDVKALQQTIQNLLSNAIKYSNGSRWIKIETKKSGDEVLISIADGGLGIDAREQRRIFEPFYRGQSAVAEQIHGNGLGLSLVKKIVDAHNGKIAVESAPGAGSRFTIQLPAVSDFFKPPTRGEDAD
jgi:signal transduction histidine kinase